MPSTSTTVCSEKNRECKELSGSFTSTPKRKRTMITSYIDMLQGGEEDKINDALCEFVFGCNLPFSIVESLLFKNFIKSIRPVYVDKIPGRKKLSGTLLEKCYNCTASAHKSYEEDCVILCDGWTNSSNNSRIVVTMLHSLNSENLFLEAWDLTCQSETGEELAKIIKQSKEIAKEKYNLNVYAVVSDNASTMVKMGSILKPALWHSTCSSHTTNLLAKDVLDKELVENIITILKDFKQSEMEQRIVAKGGYRIKLPAETRWCSYRDSFKNFMDNLQYMRQIAAETKKKLNQKTMELIFNDDFIEKVLLNLNLHDLIVCNVI